MEHYLRPQETATQYSLPSSLADKVAKDLRVKRNSLKVKERQHHTDWAEAIVKDDDLWKELQKELKQSRCTTQASIQEITRKFMDERRVLLTTHAKEEEERLKAAAACSAERRRRFSSNNMEILSSRRASLKGLAEQGMKLRRAWSVGIGLDLNKLHEPMSRRNSVHVEGGESESIVDRLSMSSSSIDIKLPLREGILPASARRRSIDDVFEVLDRASNISRDVDDQDDRDNWSSVSPSAMLGMLESFAETTERNIDTETYVSYSDDCEDYDSDGDELLEDFPSQPRQPTQVPPKSVARTA